MKLFLWLLSLAALSVGARNFEPGLSIDGPLYASIARNIARTGEWFRLDAGIPDFVPFAEHPHLGFWIQALIFKVLPAADWSARIQGHLFYLAALALAYHICKKLFSARAATFTVLLLWSWSVFSNYFSNFYLDPGCLVFGTLFLLFYARSLRDTDLLVALAAGTLLALAFLQKGLSALGFGPVALLIAVYASLGPSARFSRIVSLSASTLLACSLVLASYALLLSSTSVPEFLDIYWDRQFSQRFGRSWDGTLIFSGGFWQRLARDTHGLLWLLPLAIFALRKKGPSLFLPLSFFASFALMYAPASRSGSQYWIMLMPPLAMLLGAALDSALLRMRPSLNPNPTRLQNLSASLALSLVLVIQYLPIPTHHPRSPAEIPTLLHLKKTQALEELVLIRPIPRRDFTLGASFAWYADLRVSYLDSLPSHRNEISARKAYLLQSAPAKTNAQLLERGLCPVSIPSSSQLAVICIKN